MLRFLPVNNAALFGPHCRGYSCNKFPTGGEVPAQKLAALQKVLQSEFCNAVREVYEHVYETVDISGSPDIRASATAKVRKVTLV